MSIIVVEDEAATIAYARLMALLAERSVSPWVDSQGRAWPKLTADQRRQQCERWAAQCQETRPHLAAYLTRAAAQFALTVSKEV